MHKQAVFSTSNAGLEGLSAFNAVRIEELVIAVTDQRDGAHT